jgi:hypothetical protein
MIFNILLQAGRGIGKSNDYQDPAEAALTQKIFLGIIATVVIIGGMAYFMSLNKPNKPNKPRKK